MAARRLHTVYYKSAKTTVIFDWTVSECAHQRSGADNSLRLSESLPGDFPKFSGSTTSDQLAATRRSRAQIAQYRLLVERDLRARFQHPGGEAATYLPIFRSKPTGIASGRDPPSVISTLVLILRCQSPCLEMPRSSKRRIRASSIQLFGHDAPAV